MLGNAPHWLKRGEAVEPMVSANDPFWGWVVLWVFVLAVLVAFGVWAWRRRFDDVGERAFRGLANRMLLTPRARRAVRDLARAHGSATAAAILLSPSAMTEGEERMLKRRSNG